MQARRLLLLETGGRNEHPQPPRHAPPTPSQENEKTKPNRHGRPQNKPRHDPTRNSKGAPAPKAWPSPSASGSHHPSAAPPRPHRHSSREYSLVAAGSAVFLVMAAASVMYCRVKKVGTVRRPWATGLSGQLQRAFVTGICFFSFFSIAA